MSILRRRGVFFLSFKTKEILNKNVLLKSLPQLSASNVGVNPTLTLVRIIRPGYFCPTHRKGKIGRFHSCAPSSSPSDPRFVRYDRQIHAWTAPCPMGVSDTRTVRRSIALRGHDFPFQEYITFDAGSGLLQALGITAAVAAMNAALSFGPTRNMLQRMLPPGSGPTDQAMDAGSYECRIVGRTAGGSHEEVSLRVAGDPGNRVTVKCVCESALALAINEADLPQRFGVLTPSVSLGHALVARLAAAGFEVR